MKYFIVAVVVLFVGSCAPEQGDRQAMIRAEAQKKIDEFKSNKLKICYEEIERLATLQVDSMLIEKSRLEKDDLEKPAIPVKPTAPEIKTPFDDSEVKPIID